MDYDYDAKSVEAKGKSIEKGTGSYYYVDYDYDAKSVETKGKSIEKGTGSFYYVDNDYNFKPEETKRKSTKESTAGYYYVDNESREKSTGRIESYYVDSIDTVGADNADYYYYEDEYKEDENHVRSEIVLSPYPPFLKES